MMIKKSNPDQISNEDEIEKSLELRFNFTFDSRDAAVKAARCLNCFDAPCSRSCPTKINVALFIKQIAEGNAAGAARTIFSENPLGGICARVCPAEVLCEGACVFIAQNQPAIEIARLQQYAMDNVKENRLIPRSQGKLPAAKVAIIGAGAAGLSCAHYLNESGIAVSIYESKSEIGGLLNGAIADYKITREIALEELKSLLDPMIELRFNEKVDLDKLQGIIDSFDAVFIAVGLGQYKSLNMNAEKCSGVIEAVDFINKTNRDGAINSCISDEVIVIGAGNTAIDASIQARRLGAKNVTLAYRRSLNEMPAYKKEYELALELGVKFIWNVQVKSLIHTEGILQAVELQQDDHYLREQPTDSYPGNGQLLRQNCGMLIEALGQQQSDLLESGSADKTHNLQIHPSGRTSIASVFAGGDCLNNGGEVVNAVQDGKIAAGSIIEYLKSQKDL
jgi:dihydropyrimidine dehydrogenase (NAD+) subunit PreT